MLKLSNKGTSKNSHFFVRTSKYRPDNRSLPSVNEASRTKFMFRMCGISFLQEQKTVVPLSRKKCTFRDAHNWVAVAAKASIALAVATLFAGCVADNNSAISSSLPVSSNSVISSSSAAVSSVIAQPSSSIEPVSSSSVAGAVDLPLVVAINAGGGATTLDGVEFIADKYARGGTTNSTADNVSGGVLYQSERYGALSYEIPVTANGNYTLELHFAEIYQTAAGARSFSVAVEGATVIRDLDLYLEAGHDAWYTETFDNIAVNDGSITIELIAGVENPTIAGFAIYSADGELDTTFVPDTSADLSKFSAYTQKYTDRTVITSNHATGHIGDFFFTHWKDGGSTSLTMDTNGDFNVTWQGGGYNYVGGPGWHFGDENRVIGYRFDQDSGASYITLYGWGYDKDMPKSNPAHLVEYYILQRWSFDPSQGATYGKTFVSNGVEYSTYRSTRNQKPSINSTSTFYQYWSKPSQQQALGQDHKIIFADHVKAWADTGWILPDMNNLDASDDPTYQVMAVEVFNPGSNGTGSGQVWDATP
jgi:hypothetical protein